MPAAANPLSLVLIALLKGVVFREEGPPLWQSLLGLQARVRDYVAVLGLELHLDEAEGHAFLRQRQPAEGEPELPRLVVRRPLSHPVSLLLVLLRKRLAELDASGGDTRLVLSRGEIEADLRQFLADTTNEARLAERIASDLNKVVELGFARRLKGSDDKFEVPRVLKSFVDAQWLSDFEQRLAAYRGAGRPGASGEGDPS